jgi:hypothetical protein
VLFGFWESTQGGQYSGQAVQVRGYLIMLRSVGFFEDFEGAPINQLALLVPGGLPGG